MPDNRRDYDYRFVDEHPRPVTPWRPPQRTPDRHGLWYRTAADQLTEQAGRSPRWVETRPTRIEYRCLFCGSVHALDSPTLLGKKIDTPCGRGRLRVRLRLDGRYVT